MNNKARELERKAKALRRQNKIKKVKASLKTVMPEKVLTKFIIHARARRPIIREDKTLIDAMKWILTQIPKDDLYEIHNENDQLLWGKTTGLNKETFKGK